MLTTTPNCKYWIANFWILKSKSRNEENREILKYSPICEQRDEKKILRDSQRTRIGANPFVYREMTKIFDSTREEQIDEKLMKNEENKFL